MIAVRDVLLLSEPTDARGFSRSIPETVGKLVECPSGHHAARRTRANPNRIYCAACGNVWAEATA